MFNLYLVLVEVLTKQYQFGEVLSAISHCLAFTLITSTTQCTPEFYLRKVLILFCYKNCNH